VDAQNGVAGALPDNNPNVTLTTNTDGAWVVDALCIRNATGTTSVVGMQTERWNYRTTANNIDGAGSTMGPKSPAGDVTMSWTTGSNSGYSISAVALKPAGAGNICWSSELLTNPGFETGDATGWTNGGGGAVDIGNGCTMCDDPPHSGSYQAYWQTDSDSTYYLYQTVDLSNYATEIDAGNAVITATGWLISNEYPAQDLFDMEVRFYDGTLTEIVGDRYDTGTKDVEPWGEYGIQAYPIPAGARSVEVRFNTWEDPWDAGSADDFSVKVGTRCPVTTFEKRVTASSDDAEEPAAGGTPDLTSSDLELVQESSLQQVGMRFTGVTVPSGATISDAYIQFTGEEPTHTDQTDLILYGEKQPDPLTFTATANNITGRNANKTSAEVQWSNLPQWTPTDQTWNSPNIAAVIQEIVDQPGWNSGQAMVIMIVGNPSGHRNAHSYDNGNPDFAPLLHIEYSLVADNTPDAFDFTDQTGVALSTQVESDIVQVTGMDNGTTISIDGGGSYEYRICADGTCSGAPAYTSTAGTIDSGQYVQLRLTSSASNSTETVATLTVGTAEVDWSVTTVAGGGGISFDGSGGQAGGGTGTSFLFDIGTPGTDRLVVLIADDESAGYNLTGVTVDGKSCNLVAIAENTVTGQNHQEMWYCDEDDLGASSGPVTVAITAGAGTGWTLHAHLYTGVHQGGPTDFGIDNTSVDTTVTVSGIDVPANGLAVMGAAEGTQNCVVNTWTSPLEERTNSPDPSSADLITASGIESSAQTNKTYVATFNCNFNRGTGIVGVWPEASYCSGVIAFRSADSAGVATGDLTINKPTGTVQDDVMIASIGVRPETATITAPSGWALVRRINNTTATQNSLAVYYKVAGASEPASYTWTIPSHTGAAGGIQTFSGVNTADPIDVEDGQTTAWGLVHATPSVVTTVADTMLVTSHTFSSPATWTPPSHMTERIDVSGGNQATEGNYVLQAAAGATGTKTAYASTDDDVGNAHILALKPARTTTIGDGTDPGPVTIAPGAGA
jgi:hypothetical protein